MKNTERIRLILGMIILLTAVSAAQAFAGDKYKGYARGEIFITAAELSRLIRDRDPKLVVIAVTNTKDYLTGHIPGSFQLWRPDYAAGSSIPGRLPDNIIGAEGFTKLMQRLGVDPDSRVVVYDHKYDASRVWWAFFYFGKTDVRILDGGIRAWTLAGYATDMMAGGKAARQGTWVAKVTHPTLLVDTPEISRLKDRTDAHLWDVRSNSEFCGDEIKQGASRAGRIPWGVQADYSLVKSKANDAEWLPAAEVQKVLDTLGFDRKKHQYFSCQSGVRTTQWIATLYAMGWPIERLHSYDGSWIAWSKDEKLPIEIGCPDTTPAPWQIPVKKRK